MDATSPLFAIAAALTAVATAFFLAKSLNLPDSQGRSVPLDGLRGYLAIGVFIHHSSCWYPYVRLGQWHPGSHFYDFLGYGSVALFFMITGFLFFSKILDAKEKPIDWLRLYVSRTLRLIPLYVFMLACMLLVIACLSGFSLREPVGALARNIGGWLIYENLNINGVKRTALVTAGVAWTLSFEWLFYFMLPPIALLVRGTKSVSIAYVVAGGAAVVFIVHSMHSIRHPNWFILQSLLTFTGGMLAAVVVRSQRLRTLAQFRASSVAALACLAVAMMIERQQFQVFSLHLVFLAVAFIIIACGNSLFGVLTIKPARLLGEISYSTYLLHGLFLFVLFRYVIGFGNASRLYYLGHWLDPWGHWAIIIGCTPMLVLLCSATFRWIESPFLRQTTAVTAWLRSATSQNRRIPRKALAQVRQ